MYKMAPRLSRPRPQKRQNFQSSQRYKPPSRWPQQNVQMPSPAPWNSQPNNQLNDMEMELELMRRKRQMLQEKRQLLEEQAELERIQNEQHSGYSNMNPWDESLPYNKAGPSEHQAKRGQKRAGSALNYGQAKRFDGSEKRSPHSMDYQATKDIGPVQLPTQTFQGAETASRSTLGRMELCLGHVLKEMREQILNARKISPSPSQLKILKQRIRDRIHKLLMNKPVPDTAQIHKMYRNLHTAKGDERLINAVMESRGTASPLKAGAPAMFESITADTPKPSPRAQTSKGKSRYSPMTPEKTEQYEKIRIIKMKLRILMEEKMDGVFDKLVMLASDGVESEGEALKSDDAAAETAPDAPALSDEAPATSDKAPAATADALPADQQESAENDNENKETPDVIIIDPKEEEKKFIEAQVMKCMAARLPHLLTRYKNHMIAFLANDPVFIDLGLKAPEKLPELKKTKIYDRLYHVKIMSKPSLPERAVMKQFLDQFNTVSIKKHKAVYNLLFVGVGSLEDQQRLLEQNGTIVGGKTLDIRVSEKAKTVKSESETDAPHAYKDENAEIEEGKIKSENETNQTKDNGEVTVKDDMPSTLDKEISDLFRCISGDSKEGTSENAEETIEIPDEDQDDLDPEDAEMPDEDEDETAETQNDASDTQNEANGVVEIADDDLQGEDAGIEEEEDAVAQSKGGEAEQKSEDNATGIRTRRSSRIPPK